METRLCNNVSIGNDVISEDPEDFLVVLSTTDARVDLAPNTSRITIEDDDDGNNLLQFTIFLLFAG